MRLRRSPIQLLLMADSGAGSSGFSSVGSSGSSIQATAGMMLADRYKLIEPIASGGMAQVWLGEDTALVRQVAIKILHPHLATDEGFVTRFRREAVASARLSHPSIVAVYDTVSESGIEAIVMELIEGRTLRAVLDEVGALPPADVVDVGVQISAALDHAHRAGIVHRDIKPANIMVSADRRILVTDFGIAKANKDADLTHTGTLLGTAKYLAPEQVTGEPVDPRADLYSLGVVLYEAATGFPPFLAETDAGTALARLQGDVPRCRHRRASVPVELDEVIHRSMAQNPADRHDRAESLRIDLTKVDLNNIRPTTADLDGPTGPGGLSSGVTMVDRAATPGGGGPIPGGHPQPDQSTAPQMPQPAANSGTSVLPQSSLPKADERAKPKGRAAKKQAKQAKKAGKAAGKAAGRPNSRSNEGARLPIDGRQRPTKTIAAVLIIFGMVVAGLLLTGLLSNAAITGGPDIPIASASAFDPLGSGDENNDLAALSIDGDEASAWETEGYRLRPLSNLKDGVGLVLTLDGADNLNEISLVTGSEDWSGEIFVADDTFGPNDGSFATEAYGEPAATIEGGGRNETVSLGGASGSHLLIWLSDPGVNDEGRNKFDLYEVAVR